MTTSICLSNLFRFYDTPLSSKQSPLTGSAFSISERMWLSYKNKTWLFFSQWQTNENEIFCTSLRRRESKKFHLVLNWVSTHIRVLSTCYHRSSSLCPRQFKHPSPNPTLSQTTWHTNVWNFYPHSLKKCQMQSDFLWAQYIETEIQQVVIAFVKGNIQVKLTQLSWFYSRSPWERLSEHPRVWTWNVSLVWF